MLTKRETFQIAQALLNYRSLIVNGVAHVSLPDVLRLIGAYCEEQQYMVVETDIRNNDVKVCFSNKEE